MISSVRRLPFALLGTDFDPDVLRLARHHAREAGVQEEIEFAQRPFDELSSRREYGCIITNPPYGQRIGQSDEVDALYQSMPEVLRRLPTWSHYVLTDHPNFEEILGQKADRRRKLYNGRIACTYFQFHGPRPPRPTAESADETGETGKTEELSTAEVPAKTTAETPTETPEIKAVFGGLSAKTIEQGKLFRTRLLKRAHHLRRWPTRREITCFRLYDRDIPEIPLVVDRYENALHITEYERPHDRTPAEHADWLDLMARTAANALEVDPRDTFLKSRLRQRGATQYEKVDRSRCIYEVGEGGLRFLVNLSDYIDTGLFLDHRITRSEVRDQAKGKRFLNLFAYTGAFTVYAADGAAVETTTVDLSKQYLEWAQRNLKLNGFDGPEHRFVNEDCLAFLDREGRQYDLAVVDPPTFSNSKKTEVEFDIQRDHVLLLRKLFKRMAPGGVVYFSTNFRRFRFEEDRFEGVSIREISKRTVPEDFRNQRIHRCWRIEMKEK